MKTKNCRVRTEDLKAGRVIYVSHPIFGIVEHQVKSKPFYSWPGMFIKVETHISGRTYDGMASIHDMGITRGESYNYRRTFFKRKQAEEWGAKMRTDPGFIKQYKAHCESIKELSWSTEL